MQLNEKPLGQIMLLAEIQGLALLLILGVGLGLLKLLKRGKND